ncbi:MAG: DUF1223 domain-containing protein [Alphaproteobacteria bacterium]|uniref:DUF1223 domain-containing protein n=1 Tax=Hyphomonas sp. TaxID=87 RepID=UPI001D7C97F7|nr:DUF1223 domain-containing protein [Hyphomonas sp.]MBU3920940.1 DUF1223 domain-containing protein [Alphaproteobacteria bacterium]MBU4061934.1 DUF1223 domain-containing protein [Alphaproteobacteria bacterium]MBU4166089.1 DUF1223 domain-containing protein [Alphaproteobacteria bacterium]MBU4568608.1 DUF1223 domain-containing protein [Alphaproteobacteria bacterium]
MTRLFLVLALLFGAAASAHAEGPVLVELFASKNCRACPAAYRTLKTVEAERGDGVLVLTWAVDYWDYLGGKESMALPESKERQRAYVDRFSLRGPYTPQTVYNGLEQTAGNKPTKVGSALMKAEMAAPAGVQLKRSGRRVTLTGQPGSLADIWWVSYLDADDNKTPMPNPVTSVRQIGPWLGGNAEIEMPACESGCALIVQEAGMGRVLATMRAG